MASGWNLRVPTIGGGNTGGGVGGSVGVFPKESEYGCAVHFNVTNSGPL